eukprot:11061418-Alexandrium_andersonii.AAC.1
MQKGNFADYLVLEPKEWKEHFGAKALQSHASFQTTMVPLADKLEQTYDRLVRMHKAQREPAAPNKGR